MEVRFHNVILYRSHPDDCSNNAVFHLQAKFRNVVFYVRQTKITQRRATNKRWRRPHMDHDRGESTWNSRSRWGSKWKTNMKESSTLNALSIFSILRAGNFSAYKWEANRPLGILGGRTSRVATLWKSHAARTATRYKQVIWDFSWRSLWESRFGTNRKWYKVSRQVDFSDHVQ